MNYEADPGDGAVADAEPPEFIEPELLSRIGASVISYGHGGKVNAVRLNGYIYYVEGALAGHLLGTDPHPEDRLGD